MICAPKVLVVDDNEAFLALFLSFPEARDLAVYTATSAANAVEVLRQESVDLIISDIEMPEMSGFDLFTLVQDTYPDIPVILITAFGSTEQAVRAVKQGAFHYFEKPLTDKADLFWTTVREALAKRRMLRDLASLQRAGDYHGSSPVRHAFVSSFHGFEAERYEAERYGAERYGTVFY